MKRGIDVSYLNGVIDWERVKPQIDFAIIRAGYGEGEVDKAFHTNISACEELSIPVGLYWYSYAYTAEMARQEADNCLKQARRYEIVYPIAYSFSYDSARWVQEKGIMVTKELVMELSQAFCSCVARLGYQAAVYMNQFYMERYFDPSQIENQGYDIWYSGVTDRSKIALWQYSTEGHVEGIDRKVNLDYALKDFHSENEKF